MKCPRAFNKSQNHFRSPFRLLFNCRLMSFMVWFNLNAIYSYRAVESFQRHKYTLTYYLLGRYFGHHMGVPPLGSDYRLSARILFHISKVQSTKNYGYLTNVGKNTHLVSFEGLARKGFTFLVSIQKMLKKQVRIIASFESSGFAVGLSTSFPHCFSFRKSQKEFYQSRNHCFFPLQKSQNVGPKTIWFSELLFISKIPKRVLSVTESLFPPLSKKGRM